ncbi:unnamed protein product [Zymoseptoria tritici ST99CH_1A5]|uniref:Uncharacterized protein n=1 Tax=Zymoseptoria tritici ST99CH_1A5 TaxID=1276529 RepID=A0A1Y6M2W2_ZYMTR|nr:unnamed protein product [Zymoseptoria tritici ST99CH_1A5]
MDAFIRTLCYSFSWMSDYNHNDNTRMYIANKYTKAGGPVLYEPWDLAQHYTPSSPKKQTKNSDKKEIKKEKRKATAKAKAAETKRISDDVSSSEDESRQFKNPVKKEVKSEPKTEPVSRISAMLASNKRKRNLWTCPWLIGRNWFKRWSRCFRQEGPEWNSEVGQSSRQGYLERHKRGISQVGMPTPASSFDDLFDDMPPAHSTRKARRTRVDEDDA